MIDLKSFPISGSFLLAAGAYAGLSVFAGQLIGERMVERSGWPVRCEAGIQQRIAEQTPPPRVIPETDCKSVLGWLHPQLAQACDEVGNPDFAGPAGEARRRAQELRDRLEAERLGRAAANAGSRCDCAAAAYLGDARVSLAVYAGSARMISLPWVEGMERELGIALDHPHCKAITEARR